jgi:tRNA threonylcarbamoyladenosine biosynthesis protein TsaB
METNDKANTHALFVQVAIDKIMKDSAIPTQNIDAIVVTMGPGSYTGLRVGLASAKGIAYALNKPIIGLSTLALLAKHAISKITRIQSSKNIQIFSMIDAKRMEVFGAIYHSDGSLKLPAQAIVLDATYLEKLLENGPLLCIGNGSGKANELISNDTFYCFNEQYDIQDLIQAAIEKWNKKEFEDIAYSSPHYLKDFYQGPGKSI